MKVKDVYKKYKGYTVMLFGKPLSESSTPFTHLPKNKDLDECTVVDIKVEERKQTILSFNINLTKGKKEESLGDVYCYIK